VAPGRRVPGERKNGARQNLWGEKTKVEESTHPCDVRGRREEKKKGSSDTLER